jgi:hypothetical protein
LSPSFLTFSNSLSTHLDSLAERLREPRIQAIIEPMLAGLELGNIPNDDIQFVIDLGLCKMHP